MLGSGFLEAMNALLASGEVPGLFDGDDYTALMSACRDSAARDGVIIDSEEELWRRFTSIVQRNLQQRVIPQLVKGSMVHRACRSRYGFVFAPR